MIAIAWQVLVSKIEVDRPLPTESFAFGNVDGLV